MYRNFHSIEDLYQWIEEDKNWTGAEGVMRNRYPVRFVLFENFYDFYAFTEECNSHHVFVQSMEGWMKDDVDDSLLTYSKLGKMFKEYISKVPSNDFVIAPFSEITRFYENTAACAEFDSLVKTIRLVESNAEAQEIHQRIYVPIIGMQSKMYRFKDDANIYILEYLSQSETSNYHLILTNGTLYGVRGLEEDYTVCRNVREWIAMWKQNAGEKHRIICSSKALFNNAHHAQPDNAFDYAICRNAFEFLSKGLSIDLGDAVGTDDEMPYWERLAKEIDIADFDFFKYVTGKFNVVSIDSVQDFMQVWFDCSTKDDFPRWLLKTYYIIVHKENTYLKRVLRQCPSLTTIDLFATMATLIFEESQNEPSLAMRSAALREGAKRGVKLTEIAERIIEAKLKAMVTDPMRGIYTAMKYVSPISDAEKSLMLQWLGDGRIDRSQLKDLYPELYYYTAPMASSHSEWVNVYFTEYNKSKIANKITPALSEILAEKNASSVDFEKWRDEFKTVKTLLHNRSDIDVFYWVDGLGVDWIPFITSVVKEREADNVFLNEVLIATAELPTRTSNNRVKLEELCGEKLKKIGDVDSFAHQQKKYPNFIIDELKMVKEKISDVLSQYNGRKIAFVSDHGISYLANKASGLNLAGVKSDHSGRCGEWEQGVPTSDNHYIILEDGKTLCSLSHHSLTTKVPSGQGAHGGCTPEEVLVPIFIISNSPTVVSWTASLLTPEVSGTNARVRFEIKNIQSADKPFVAYNGRRYPLSPCGGAVYESADLQLDEKEGKVVLSIGGENRSFDIQVSTGVQEDELFGF